MVFEKTVFFHLTNNNLMRNMIKKFIFLVTGLLIFSACNYEKIENEIPQINTISINKKYRINLPEEHQSGYTWQLQDNYDKKIIDNFNTVWRGNTKGVDYNFKTLAVGETTLTFVRRKYSDTNSVKQFVVKITGH
ncbi:MAG: hypothetical protein JWO32_1026 [Bacteroidetes bacterium]|nr:hypothetical protein [Bacteroidota bacterium]